MSNEKLVAACGLYCGACEIYRAEHDGNIAKTKEIMAGLSARTGNNYTLEDMKCDGCSADGNINLWCRGCGIRVCARQKTADDRCSPECSDYPCPKLTDFANDGMAHHKEIFDNLKRLQRAGITEHAEQEEKRWLCPECGAHLSWYGKKCPKCGAKRPNKLFKVPENWPD